MRRGAVLLAVALVAAAALAPVGEAKPAEPAAAPSPPAASPAAKAKAKRCTRGSRARRRRCARRAKRCARGSRAVRRRCARRLCASGRLTKRERRRLRCPRRRPAVERPAAPAPAPPPPAPGGPAPGLPAEPGAPAELPRYLGVTAREYTLVLSRGLLGAGAQTIELDNRGEDPHDLVIRPEGSAVVLYDFDEVESGHVQTWPTALAAGRYELVCSIAGHEALGMKASLEVR